MVEESMSTPAFPHLHRCPFCVSAPTSLDGAWFCTDATCGDNRSTRCAKHQKGTTS